MRLRRHLATCDAGAAAAEFAMVLPLLLILLFGVIDGGRFLWEYNRAEKATQVGARMAAVTDMVGGGFADFSFAVDDSVPVIAGDPVPTDNFDNMVCGVSTCSCTGGDVCSEIEYDSAAFTRIVDRMAVIDPAITADNVEITYRNVGLGFSGDPGGPDVAPLITVALKAMKFQPITCLVFACEVGMPDFRSSLTAEDSSGTQSN